MNLNLRPDRKTGRRNHAAAEGGAYREQAQYAESDSSGW
jgi:hypothetical protein